MRRVGEPVEPLAAGQPPRAFRWRGRRYVVQRVLTHWVETGAWWDVDPATLPAAPTTAPPVVGAAGEPASLPELLAQPVAQPATDPAAQPVPDTERAVWRVEAGAAATGVGVLDLCVDRTPGDPDRSRGGWSIRHVYD